MTVFERLFTLVVGLFLSLFAFADEPGRMGEGMMGGQHDAGHGRYGAIHDDYHDSFGCAPDTRDSGTD